MNSIRGLLKEIQSRPAMYLGRNYISCLKSFLDGFYLSNSHQISDSSLMTDFQLWIEKKYKINTSHSWCDIILFHSQDESDALFKFFQEFDLFLNSHTKD